MPDPICSETYVTGFRRGEPCPYKASAIVNLYDRPFHVCGYHAKAYADRVIYPLDWSLHRIRAFRLEKL